MNPSAKPFQGHQVPHNHHEAELLIDLDGSKEVMAPEKALYIKSW